MNKISQLVILLLVVLTWVGSISASQLPPLPKNLAETLDLYLSSDSSYRTGDLITRSHLKEFQIYLRTTQGPSLATHARWAAMMLEDRDTLPQLFYNGRADYLRKTAKLVGGYAKIHQLTRLPQGRMLVQSAARVESVEQIVKAIAQAEKQAAETNGPGKKQVTEGVKTQSSQPQRKQLRLFTAHDFLTAVVELQSKRQKKMLEKSATKPAER